MIRNKTQVPQISSCTLDSASSLICWTSYTSLGVCWTSYTSLWVFPDAQEGQADCSGGVWQSQQNISCPRAFLLTATENASVTLAPTATQSIYYPETGWSEEASPSSNIINTTSLQCMVFKTWKYLTELNKKVWAVPKRGTQSPAAKHINSSTRGAEVQGFLVRPDWATQHRDWRKPFCYWIR